MPDWTNPRPARPAVAARRPALPAIAARGTAATTAARTAAGTAAVSTAMGAALAVIAGSTPAAAQFLAERFAPANPPACYARIYEPEHLAAHPRQRLESFILRAEPEAEAAAAPAVALAFAFTLKGDPNTYEGLAFCDDRRAGADCAVEGDGGGFALRASDGALLLTVAGRLEVEGGLGFSPDLARGGDDTVVKLFPAPPEACGVR